MKKKLLVFASTFPRWKNDTLPPFVYELSKRLTDKFDVSVLTPNYPGAKQDEVMDKMKVHRFRYFLKKYEKLAGSGGILPTLKKNRWFYFQIPFFLVGEFFALKKQIKENRPDIIHAHWIIPQGIASYLNYKIYGVPYVITSHGSDLMGLRGFNWIKKLVLKNAENITVVSNTLKKEVLEIDSSLRNKIKIIPMGIDIKLFSSKKKDNSIKNKYGISGEFLLFVGRLAPEKGIDLLIEAMPKVIKNNPKTKLMIIGDGTLREELKQRVKELKIENNIIFRGWINNKDLPKYYATADLFICPSLREGSPVSYFEALACGTQILVGDIPISRELVEKFGGNITDLNSSKITNQIISSLKNKKQIKNVKEYDWTNVKNKFLEVLR